MEPRWSDSRDSVTADHSHTPRRNRSYPEAKWKEMKDTIKSLYIDGNCTLKHLMQMLAANYDFSPTEKMYKLRLERWGFNKNITEKRLRDNEQSLPDRRRDKYLRRKRLGKYSSVSTIDTSPSTNRASVPNTPSCAPIQAHAYESTCPYGLLDKKFRLVETFSDGSVYRADSLGYRAYIDPDDARPCTDRCFCRSHTHTLSPDFTFIVYKYPDRMDVTIRSDALLTEIRDCMPLDGLIRTDSTLNGLVLLRYRALLKQHLLRAFRLPLQERTLELRLLVDGLLGDGQVFKSFGYEHLYECGYLDHSLWTLFQQQRLDSDIEDLDDAFRAADDWEKSPGILIDCPATQIERKSGPFSSIPNGKSPSEPFNSLLLNTTPKITPRGAGGNRCGRGNSHSPVTGTALLDGKDRSIRQIDEVATTLAIGQERAAQRNLLPASKADNLLSGVYIARGSLTTAAASGDREAAQLLLDRGADVNSINQFGKPALVVAAEAGHLDVVRLLLDRGADVNGTIYPEKPALVVAAEAGHLEVVRLLLDHGADVNRNGYFEKPALVAAAKAGHLEVVRLLLEHGADLNVTDRLRESAASAVIPFGHLELIQLILNHGGTLGDRDFHFLIAAALGKIPEMQQLLADGANIDAMTTWGSALNICVMLRRDEAARCLLRHGADVQLAALHLGGRGQRTTGTGTVSGFLKMIWKLQSGRQTRPSPGSLPYLRRKFFEQYQLMSDASRHSHTKLRNLSSRFQNYRQAWDAGITVIRRLALGHAPMDVYETVAFLSLARAITETLRDTQRWDYTNNFNRDLPEWQRLFSDMADLEAYRDAAKRIWGLDIASMLIQSDLNYNTLQDLTDLASILVGRARDLLDLDFSDGNRLDQSQLRWSERNSPRNSEPGQDNPPCLSRLLPISTPPHLLPLPTPPRLLPLSTPPRPPDFDDPCKNNLTQDKRPERVVILLIFSAIFAIMVIFLQGLRRCMSGYAVSLLFHRVDSVEERLSILSDYLGVPKHILFSRY